MACIYVYFFEHGIPVYYNINLLTNCCVAMRFFLIVFSDKRKTSAASLAEVVFLH